MPELPNSDYARPLADGSHQTTQIPKPKDGAFTHADYDRLLAYDPETGIFTWKVTLGSRALAGTQAGYPNVSRGVAYRIIKIKGVKYQAARLAWLLMTGEWPVYEVDHWDRDSLNNRWSNLRAATHQQNCAIRGARSDSASGVRGVYIELDKFVVNCQGKYIGVYRTLDEAKRAYALAARQNYGVFAPMEAAHV